MTELQKALRITSNDPIEMASGGKESIGRSSGRSFTSTPVCAFTCPTAKRMVLVDVSIPLGPPCLSYAECGDDARTALRTTSRHRPSHASRDPSVEYVASSW